MGTNGLVVSVREERTRRAVANAKVALWTESGPLPSGATDASGRFDARDLPDGWVGARVEADGFAPSDPQWKNVGDGIVLAMHFDMEKGVRVDGLVVTPDGQPVAGARIAAVRGVTLRRADIPFAETTSDADGRFEIAAVPRTDDHCECGVLVVSHDSYATTDAVVAPAPRDGDDGPMRVRIVLPPGASVRGRVLDERGGPLADARVEARPGHLDLRLQRPLGFGQSWTTHADGSVEVSRALTADTDADGRFELPGLVRGKPYTLIAGRPRDVVTAPVAIDAAGGDDPVELMIRKPSAVVVRVFDPAGRQVDDATVHVGRAGAVTREAGADGWRVENIDEPNVHLFVKAQSFVDLFRSVALAPGRTRTVRVTLKPACHIAGTVVDDAGSPVPGARVWAEDSSDVMDDAGFDDAAETDASGRFRIEDLPSKKHRVIVRGPRHPQVVVRGIRPPADDLRIVAPRAATVRVRLDLAGDAKLPREIHVLHAPLPRRGPGPDSFSEAWRCETFDLEDSVAEILRIPAPRAALCLLVPGFQRVHRRVEAKPGEAVDLGTITLEPAIRVEGRVVDADGRAVAGVGVYLKQPFVLHDRRAWTVRATTAEDGAFRLDGLSPGRVELAVAVKGFFPADFEVDVGDGNPVTLAWSHREPDRIRASFQGL